MIDTPSTCCEELLYCVMGMDGSGYVANDSKDKV